MIDLSGNILNNRYEVQKLIGRGGMAEVYEVYDIQRHTSLALKLLHRDISQDRVFLRRFKREGSTLSKLQHPNIVRFYGVEEYKNDIFMLMDFVDGESLKSEIFKLKNRAMKAERIAEIVARVTSAIQYAHNTGYIHSDLKPGNILISKTGTIQVADFGIARMTDAATATMVGAGTPAYMSPEQIKGKDPSPQTDIYALGVILYEMVTGGERPFTGERANATGSTGEKVRWEKINLAPTKIDLRTKVAKLLWPVISKCLSTNANDRYENVIELNEAVSNSLGIKAKVNIANTDGDDEESELDDLWIGSNETGENDAKSTVGKKIAYFLGILALLSIVYIGVKQFQNSREMEIAITEIIQTQDAEHAIALNTESAYSTQLADFGTQTAMITPTPSVTLTPSFTPSPTPDTCKDIDVAGFWQGDVYYEGERFGSYKLDLKQSDCIVSGTGVTRGTWSVGVTGNISEGVLYLREVGNQDLCFWDLVLSIEETKLSGTWTEQGCDYWRGGMYVYR
jgi:serine/threonine protein kinase